MKNGNTTLDAKNLSAQVAGLLHKLGAYKAFLFFLAAAALYGFILLRINTYSNAPASSRDEQTAAQAHIDDTVVDKIESLEDNSVNVQRAFDAARENPFQE